MNALLYKDFSDAYTTIELKENTPIAESLALDWNNWAVIANGKIVNKNYTPKANDAIMFRAVPHSTGNVFADIALGFLTGGIYTVISSGVEAYKAREAADKAKKDLENMKNKMRDKVTNLPYIKGATNTVATGKTEPYIIGEHLFVPYILNSGGKYQGYSVIGGENGKDQFYIVVLEGGFNKQVFRRLRSDDVTLKMWSGDTPQEDVYQFDDGVFYDAGSLIEIAQDGKPFDTPEFNKKIVQQTLNDNLRKKDDEQYEDLIYTLERYSMAADVCILFNGILAYNDDSDKINRSVTVEPSYSLDGGKTWTQFYFNQNGTQRNTFTYRTLNQLRFNAHIDFNFSAVKNLNQPIMIKLSCTTPKYNGSAYDQCYVQWVQSTVYNPDESKTGFVPERIIGETEAKLSTTIGLKIKSTTSNQDKLKKINVITCGTARTWNGVQWSAEKTPTRNPAAWLLEVLTSPTHTPSQCDDSEIDLASFGALYEFCKREKLTCDMVLTDGEPKENVLQKICQTCYATLYQDIYGKISVVSDSKKENAIAVLNEQNLISFSYEKDLARRTDGIKIKYISRAADYAEDTCLVMRKGAVRDSESILRDMNVTGITEYAQIVKYARYVMACDELRPKTATARVGKEGIFFTPLAKVLVQHPSLKIGLGSAQIKTVITEGTNITGLRLYEPITLDTAHDFTVIIQCIGNDYCTPLARAIKRYNGRTKEIEFTEPIALTSPIQPHAGDILSYGYQTETVTSPMLITGIQPDDDGYTLTLVDYNEAIYDTGDIPDYTPNISQSGDGTAGTIPAQAVTPEDLARVQRTIISPSFYVLDISPEIQSVPCKADGTLFDNTATVEIVAKLYFGIDDTDKGVNRSAALEDGTPVGTWDDNVLTLPVSLLTSNTLRVFITVRDSENRTRTAIATVNKLYAGDTPFVYIMRLSENAVRVSDDKEIIPAKIAAQKLIKSGADYIDTDYGNITVSIDGGKEQLVKTGDVFVYIETNNGLLGDDAGRFILFDDADYAANGVKIPYGAKQLIFRYRTPEGVIIQSETVPVLYDGAKGAKGEKGQRGASYWGTKKPDEAVYGDYYLDVNDGYIYEYSATYNAWVKVTDYGDFRYKQAMNDMLSVAEHAPNIQFLAVVNAWVKNLVAGTALINELFAKNIIAQNKIASSNYYDAHGVPTGNGFLMDAQTGKLFANDGIFNGEINATKGTFNGLLKQGTNFYIATRIIIKHNSDGSFRFTASNSLYNDRFYYIDTGIFVVKIPTEHRVYGIPRVICHYCSDQFESSSASPVLDDIKNYNPGNSNPRFQCSCRSGLNVFEFDGVGNQIEYLPLYFTDNQNDNYVNPQYALLTLIYI